MAGRPLILLRQPFRQGDQIVLGQHEGTVERIESRATLLKTYDGRRVIIPNSDVYTQVVTVNTAFPQRRSEYDVGIGYADDLEQACEIIVGALRGVHGVARDPAPEAIPWELAGSTVNIRARWWSEPRRADIVNSRGDAIRAMKCELTKAGIDIPFPTNVLLFHDQTEETDGDRRRQREGWPVGRSPPSARHLNDVTLSRSASGEEGSRALVRKRSGRGSGEDSS